MAPHRSFELAVKIIRIIDKVLKNINNFSFPFDLVPYVGVLMFSSEGGMTKKEREPCRVIRS